MIATSIFLIVASIIFHEFGHILIFLEKNIKVKIRFSKGSLKVGKPKDYEKLSRKEKKNLYYSGIVWGLIPLVIGCLMSPIYAFLIPLYLFGCKNDFVRFWRA